MEIKYKQPKLNDSLYGQMYWEDVDDELEPHWFARIDSVPNEKFEVLIETDSPLDFMAIRNTHSTFKKLMADILSIRKRIIQDILGNLQNLVKNRSQRKSIGESLKKNLKISSVKIYYDLSSKIEFSEEGYMDKYINELDDDFYVLLDNEGNYLEAGICDF